MVAYRDCVGSPLQGNLGSPIDFHSPIVLSYVSHTQLSSAWDWEVAYTMEIVRHVNNIVHNLGYFLDRERLEVPVRSWRSNR